MKLKQIPKEELELMSYDDIALLVLQEKGKKMRLRDIFAEVCSVLELPEETVDEYLMDFFEQMSINKKFIMLDKGFWDLQSRHKLDLVFDEDDDEMIEDEEDEVLDEQMSEEDEEDIFYDKDDLTEDVVEDDLADLVVVDDLDENNL